MQSSQSFVSRYLTMKREKMAHSWTLAKRNKGCYLFLAPYAILFFTFMILPIATSIVLSFTYYNILEPPRFIGLQNYINLILQDEVFLTSIKNTLVIAVIVGPVGYILSFLFAWFINELPKWLRAIAVVIFYAPSIAGAAAVSIFTVLFRGDAYGWFNSILMELGIIQAPYLWLTDPRYMMTIVIIISLWMSMGTGFLSFVAGFQGIDRSMYEAGYVDGVRNRWQELYHITLPSMKPMLLFGAVMSITSSFNVSDVPRALCGFPSTDYAVRTVVTHLFDYGFVRFEMGYASAVAAILFLVMILSKKAVGALLGRLGA
ncbi:MAG: sugar ABC transporter permease [Clostridia bacterium]|nr:sugar ABC transporter permease [Clostridia bacterium]